MTRQVNLSMPKAAVLVAFAIAGLAPLLASHAAANSAAVKSYSAADSAAQIKRIKHHWTPRRMRNATPMRETPSRREGSRAARAIPGASGSGRVKTVQPTPGRIRGRRPHASDRLTSPRYLRSLESRRSFSTRPPVCSSGQ